MWPCSQRKQRPSVCYSFKKKTGREYWSFFRRGRLLYTTPPHGVASAAETRTKTALNCWRGVSGCRKWKSPSQGSEWKLLSRSKPAEYPLNAPECGPDVFYLDHIWEVIDLHSDAFEEAFGTSMADSGVFVSFGGDPQTRIT